MLSITIIVEKAPPWKQTPADSKERGRQEERKKALQESAKKIFEGEPSNAKFGVSIRYSRCEGGSDSGNIVGGILDSLQNIIYKDDKQVIQISYVEWLGEQDRYQVTVTELVV